MPSKDDSYLVYGDDNQVEQEELEDLADIVDDVLATRPKKKKKNKAFKDEVLTDIDDLPSDDPQEESEEEEPEDVNEDVDEEVEDEEEEEADDFPSDSLTEVKKSSRVPVAILIVVMVAIAALLVVFSIWMSGRKTDVETGGNNGALTVTTTASPTETPEISSTDATSSAVDEENAIGFLTDTSSNTEYTLNDSLGMARNINSSALSYLNTITNNVTAENIEKITADGELAIRLAMLKKDIKVLKNYENIFITYSGSKYITACEERYENIEDMYNAALGSYDSTNQKIDVVNQYIVKENSLAVQAKEALREYLDANEVTYTETDEGFEYEN